MMMFSLLPSCYDEIIRTFKEEFEMKKNAGALLLVLALLLGLLAGCGGAQSAAEPESAQVQSAAEEASAAQAPAVPEPAGESPDEEISAEEASVAEEPAEPEDPMAKYITPDDIEERIAGRPGLSLPLTEGASLSFWTGSPPMDATISGWSDSTANQEIEKRTGVHVEFIEVAPPAQSEAINLMLTSGDYPDIINYALTGIFTVPYLIENEIVVDLQDMMAEHAPSYSALMEADPALYLATVSDEGEIGGLCGYEYNSFFTTGALVRGDWLSDIGMTPEELVTIDDYYQYLTGVKAQGLCEYPMPLRYDAAISGSPFLNAMGGVAGAPANASAQNFYYLEDDETLVYSFTTDAYREYLTLMAQWYQEGIITRDLLNSDMLQSSAIAGGSYGIMWQDCQFMDMWIAAGQVNDPDYSLVGVKEPVLEEGQTLGNGMITNLTISLIISTACRDPELALEWLDYHFSEEGSILSQYGLEGEGLAYDEEGKPCYSELIYDNPDGLSFDNALNTYAVNINMYAQNKASLRASYEPIKQEALNAWNGTREVTKSSFTKLFTLNSEETETVRTYYTDIATYAAETIGKFLVGELSIEEEWDNYVATIESMNIGEVTEAYRSAGERYFARIP